MRRPALLAALLACLGSASAAEPPWSATLSSGWDSLYMFRGVNQLPGDANDGYGSSLAWTGTALTWTPTASDTLEIGTWIAFGLTGSDYKEFDATAAYTRSFGPLSLSLGYALYAVLSETNGRYNHELNAALAWEQPLGPVTLAPAVLYAFNVGPAPANRGYVEQASSYLEFRLDATAPLPGGLASLAPWTALGVNFRSNTGGDPDALAGFLGSDHVEAGLAVPITVREAITVSPYVAASWQWQRLAGTQATTWWGGVSVTVSF